MRTFIQIYEGSYTVFFFSSIQENSVEALFSQLCVYMVNQDNLLTRKQGNLGLSPLIIRHIVKIYQTPLNN